MADTDTTNDTASRANTIKEMRGLFSSFWNSPWGRAAFVLVAAILLPIDLIFKNDLKPAGATVSRWKRAILREAPEELEKAWEIFSSKARSFIMMALVITAICFSGLLLSLLGRSSYGMLVSGWTWTAFVAAVWGLGVFGIVFIEGFINASKNIGETVFGAMLSIAALDKEPRTEGEPIRLTSVRRLFRGFFLVVVASALTTTFLTVTVGFAKDPWIACRILAGVGGVLLTLTVVSLYRGYDNERGWKMIHKGLAVSAIMGLALALGTIFVPTLPHFLGWVFGGLTDWMGSPKAYGQTVSPVGHPLLTTMVLLVILAVYFFVKSARYPAGTKEAPGMQGFYRKLGKWSLIGAFFIAPMILVMVRVLTPQDVQTFSTNTKESVHALWNAPNAASLTGTPTEIVGPLHPETSGTQAGDLPPSGPVPLGNGGIRTGGPTASDEGETRLSGRSVDELLNGL